MQNRSYGLLRMHLECTRVHKPPVNVPYSSGWHHVWCRSIGETQDSKEEKAAVSAEENKALVRRFFEEVYNRGNLDVADEVLAPDFAWKLPAKDADIEDYKQWVAEQLAASSDLHFSIEEQVAEGEKVVTRLIGSGTHDQKGFGGVRPQRGAHNDRGHHHPPRDRRQDRGRAEQSGLLAILATAPRTRKDRTRAHRAGA